MSNGEILRTHKIQQYVVSGIAKLFPSVMLSALHFLTCSDTSELDVSLMAQYLGHTPQGGSLMSVEHLG